MDAYSKFHHIALRGALGPALAALSRHRSAARLLRAGATRARATWCRTLTAVSAESSPARSPACRNCGGDSSESAAITPTASATTEKATESVFLTTPFVLTSSKKILLSDLGQEIYRHQAMASTP